MLSPERDQAVQQLASFVSEVAKDWCRVDGEVVGDVKVRDDSGRTESLAGRSQPTQPHYVVVVCVMRCSVAQLSRETKRCAAAWKGDCCWRFWEESPTQNPSHTRCGLAVHDSG